MTLLLGATLKLGYSLAQIPAWIFVSMLIVGAFTDIDHWIIPDRITLGGIAVGLALAAIAPIAKAPGNPLNPAPGGVVWNLLEQAPREWLPFFNAAAGAAAGWLILWLARVIGTLVFKKEGMGMGDVKLFAMFGAFVGLGFLVPILMISSVIGTGVGLWMIVRAKVEKRGPVDPAVAGLDLDYEARRGLLDGLEGEERAAAAAALAKPGAVGMVRHHLPFGPSLAIAAYLVYFWGEGIVAAVMRWLESRTDFGF
jgi:prepilin signal peptidase PulO-like enzyme (type II secretory pathway)